MSFPKFWLRSLYVAGWVASVGLYRISRPKLAVLLFLGLVSTLHYRYFAFVVFIAGPYVVLGLGVVRPNVIKPKFEFVLAIAFSVIATVLLAVGVANRCALRGGYLIWQLYIPTRVPTSTAACSIATNWIAICVS